MKAIVYDYEAIGKADSEREMERVKRLAQSGDKPFIDPTVDAYKAYIEASVARNLDGDYVC